MKNDFREMLKRETGEHHAKVDRVISRLDVCDRGDLTTFLCIHKSCFHALAVAANADAELSERVSSLVDRIKRDLAVLRFEEVANCDPFTWELDPLAIEYVVEGSRLGARALSRRWRMADDPAVAAAGAFFFDPASPERWRCVCAKLSAIEPGTRRSDDILRDAKGIFDRFLRTATGVIAAPARYEDVA